MLEVYILIDILTCNMMYTKGKVTLNSFSVEKIVCITHSKMNSVVYCFFCKCLQRFLTAGFIYD
jgi:hypothetical protein